MLEGVKFQFFRLSDEFSHSKNGAVLSKDVSELNSVLDGAVNTFRSNCIKAGFLLKKIKEDGFFKSALRYRGSLYHTYGDPFLEEPFELFCKNTFNLSKTTIYSLIAVAERFGIVGGNVVCTYSNFNYSQLVEMLSLSDEEIKHVDSSMSVSKIRALKKKKDKKELGPEEQKKDSPEKIQKFVFTDLDKKRDDFKISCKRFFEKYNYKAMVNGSFVGGQAFGTALFDFLTTRGFFDANNKTENPPLL